MCETVASGTVAMLASIWAARASQVSGPSGHMYQRATLVGEGIASSMSGALTEGASRMVAQMRW